MSELGSNRLAILAAEIRTAQDGVDSAAIARASRALDAGRALIEAKTLLTHGRWLPWLKEQGRLPERTAQLYMKLAELDVSPETIAVLGMEKAAQTGPTLRITTLPPADPVPLVWMLFALFIGSCAHADWCMQRGYDSPDEWLADDEQRRRWGMKNMPESFKIGWSAFQQKHAATDRASIEAMLTEAAAA